MKEAKQLSKLLFLFLTQRHQSTWEIWYCVVKCRKYTEETNSNNRFTYVKQIQVTTLHSLLLIEM